VVSVGSMRVRVAVTTALLALAAAPSAHAGQKPNGQELWRAYPLAPSPTATASRTATGATATPAATRSPAPANDGGGGGWAPIALAALAAAAGAAGVATFRRRRATPAASPSPGGAEAPTAAPVAAAPSARDEAPGPARTGRFKPRRAAERSRRFKPSPPPAAPPARRFEPSSRTAERLRAAVDMQLGREWPWPESSEGLWRCEIGPDQAALSARFRAVVHAPDGDPPRVLAVSSPGAAGGDWQSAAPLEQAVNGLAAQLVADGWEPVEGIGDPHTRRFCWRRDDAPHIHLEETAWSA
jgi:hypothetical protein